MQSQEAKEIWSGTPPLKKINRIAVQAGLYCAKCGMLRRGGGDHDREERFDGHLLPEQTCPRVEPMTHNHPGDHFSRNLDTVRR